MIKDAQRIVGKLTGFEGFSDHPHETSEDFRHLKVFITGWPLDYTLEFRSGLAETFEESGRYWIGMDPGFCEDPSEVVCYREETSDEGGSAFSLVSRFSLSGADLQDQVDLVVFLMDFYKPKGFGVDKTGTGLPLFQAANEALSKNSSFDTENLFDVFRGYKFSKASDGAVVLS